MGTTIVVTLVEFTGACLNDERRNSLLAQDDANKTIDMNVPLRERWMQDIEMFSKYLDIKSHNAAEQTDYLADNPEIKQLIADYVLTLLIGNHFIHRISFVPNLLRQIE
ncbi:PREDICTED: uncharacterized protein LOC106752266 [Dinoponera quadriceps]|uniref:Uncharacterized protein LOC106752266 n=1 Tax=Dinoponera quadriceps TaxID=609295 RepID=A0A6P3YHM3_DINQU|nr:PREDICTED: uncharacterized protein LOC106752266 [Dinoponera quadriceps]